MSKNTEKAARMLLAMQRHSWEQGVAMQAFLELGEYNLVELMSREAVFRQTADGRAAMIGVSDGVTDPCAAGEALYYSAVQTKDPQLQQGYEKLLCWAMEKAPRNAEGTVYHLTGSKEFWVDSFYMLPPFLAACGYYEEALAQIDGYWKALYDSHDGLLSHRWDDEKQSYLRKDYWGVGNGWAMAGLARVIDSLPEAYEEQRQELIEKVRGLLQKSLLYLREDGLFHDVLNNPETFVETNFSQMLAYTIYRGVKSGWLGAADKETADRLRQAVGAKVDAAGIVQGACAAPDFNSPGAAPEAQAFFLLMEHAAEALA